MSNGKNNFIRIAVISFFSDPLIPEGSRNVGGVSIYILEQAKQLANQGFFIDIYTCRESSKLKKIVNITPRVKLIRLDVGPKKSIPELELLKYKDIFLKKFYKFVDDKNLAYDIIQGHQFSSGIVGAQIKKDLMVPFVQRFHTLGKIKLHVPDINKKEIQERIKIEKETLKTADEIITSTVYEKNCLIKSYNHKKKNIHIVPIGVNFNIFKPFNKEYLRKKLRLGQKQKIMLFAGRMDVNKGALVFLKAIAEIKKKNPQLFKTIKAVLISGDPRKGRGTPQELELLQTIKSEMERSKIKSCVTLIPGMPQKKLAQYMSASDLVVMPSYYESFGMVATESMSCGTPVLASATGGLLRIVKDGETGLFAKVGDPHDFSKKMIKILSNENLQNKLAHNARKYAHQHFDWKIIIKKSIKIYKSLIK